MTSVPDDKANSEKLPLRERIPEYLTVVALGLVGATIVGFVISLIWNVQAAAAIGYTIVSLGVLLLLAGGATGGGYTSLGIGAAGALFGTRRTDEASDEIGSTWSEQARQSPQDRLREGLRPDANPRAFWQVIGGFLFIAIGIAIAASVGA